MLNKLTILYDTDEMAENGVVAVFASDSITLRQAVETYLSHLGLHPSEDFFFDERSNRYLSSTEFLNNARELREAFVTRIVPVLVVNNIEQQSGNKSNEGT